MSNWTVRLDVPYAHIEALAFIAAAGICGGLIGALVALLRG